MSLQVLKRTVQIRTSVEIHFEKALILNDQAYHVLQPTLIWDPVWYGAPLWTQGQEFSAMHPPFPSYTRPEGHTQPETHSELIYEER